LRRLSFLALVLTLVATTLIALTDRAAAGPGPGAGPAPSNASLRIVTADVNLRYGPGKDFDIIVVIPAGTKVLVMGAVVDGYAEATHDNMSGWVHTSFLSAGGQPVPMPSPNPAPGPVVGQAAATTDLNLRGGPGYDQPVLRVIPQGGVVNTTATVQNGFRYVSYQGQFGWAFDGYLGAPSNGGPTGGGATVTSALNLRKGPSTADSVILVMSAGSWVSLGPDTINGFRMVTFNGVTGWAHAAYLSA
jgi:uncharacterized protein YraI